MHGQIGIVRRERGAAMVRRAIERGELPQDVDLALAADLIAAPVYWRLAVTREAFGDRTRNGSSTRSLRAARRVTSTYVREPRNWVHRQ